MSGMRAPPKICAPSEYFLATCLLPTLTSNHPFHRQSPLTPPGMYLLGSLTVHCIIIGQEDPRRPFTARVALRTMLLQRSILSIVSYTVVCDIVFVYTYMAHVDEEIQSNIFWEEP